MLACCRSVHHSTSARDLPDLAQPKTAMSRLQAINDSLREFPYRKGNKKADISRKLHRKIGV
jgi:hypothetical protein